VVALIRCTDRRPFAAGADRRGINPNVDQRRLMTSSLPAPSLATMHCRMPKIQDLQRPPMS
jgi:hypothetical protein